MPFHIPLYQILGEIAFDLAPRPYVQVNVGPSEKADGGDNALQLPGEAGDDF